MAICDHCGNDYDKAFTVTMNGTTHTFDSFECAIQMMAPRCAHCACAIIGHGVEAGGKLFLLRALRGARGRARAARSQGHPQSEAAGHEDDSDASWRGAASATSGAGRRASGATSSPGCWAFPSRSC